MRVAKHEALKAAPEARSSPHSVAAQGFAWCNQLFTIERELKEVTPEERWKAREKQSYPVLDGYYAWLRQQKSQTMPKSLPGQAFTYSMNQWDKLTAFLKDADWRL
ncbi:transposase [Paenibacillus elgii]